MSTDAVEVNLDTSVLFNYVYANLPGDIEEDKGSLRLIDESSYYCVIGPSAHSEFEAACDRRIDLYDDLLDWLVDHPDGSIYDYDPTVRDVRTSSNDLDHIRYDVQHGWADEPRRKQLADFRRCHQDIGIFQEAVPRDGIDHVYSDLASNEPLFEALAGLGLQEDKFIVVDAVEIHRLDGIFRLIAIDSDITSPEMRESINDRIRDVEDDDLTLAIHRPQEV